MPRRRHVGRQHPPRPGGCRGAVFDPGEGTRVGLHVDAITEETCAEYRGRRYACVAVGKRKRKDVSGAQDCRQPRCMPEDMSMEDAARDK